MDTKEVTLLLKAKKQAFQSGDRVKLKVAQSNLKAGVRRGKEEYKNKKVFVYPEDHQCME